VALGELATRTETNAKTSFWGDRLIAVLFVLIASAYVAQISSPLRLIGDGVDYLLQASSAIDGQGFLLHGMRSMRPAGYPALIYGLGKFGLANSWTIVGLNCLLLGVGCWASYFGLREALALSSRAAKTFCVLTLLSFLMVRNVTYPLSDICFFGAASVCVLGLLRIERQPQVRRFWNLLLILPLLILCVELRTIGVTLIPAFFWAAIGGFRGAHAVYGRTRRNAIVSSVILLAVVVIVGMTFLQSRYMRFNAHIFKNRGVLRSIVADGQDHTAEWGEMVLNTPLSKLPGGLGIPVRLVGALAICVFAVGLWNKRKSPDSLWIYVIGFSCIVFPYPWSDARLWLPVLPFLFAYMFFGIERLWGADRVSAPVLLYCSLFCLTGFLALGYSTRSTYAGARFSELYGDGRFRDTYRCAFRGESCAGADPDGLYLLRRYDVRAEH
jgi:hypothetical protein